MQSDPEDLNTRMELLIYYAYKDLPRYADHLLWLIAHHPDAKALSVATPNFSYLATRNPAFADQIQSAWQKEMAKHPSSDEVIFNAASFMSALDPERGLDLLRKAKALDDADHSERYDRKIAAIYTAAEMEAFHPNATINNVAMPPDVGARLRVQLEDSADSALLTRTGKLLVEFSVHPPNEAQNKRGLQLIQQAIQLDPSDPKWTEALEWAETEPQRRLNYENALRAGVPEPGVVRIGAKVAEANLVVKAGPAYPPLALQARVQGAVEFIATVDTDGKVERLTLVRGHPLLLNAAKRAVLKWVYHPATVDGKAIPFQTEVLVPFQLSR